MGQGASVGRVPNRPGGWVIARDGTRGVARRATDGRSDRAPARRLMLDSGLGRPPSRRPGPPLERAVGPRARPEHRRPDAGRLPRRVDPGRRASWPGSAAERIRGRSAPGGPAGPTRCGRWAGNGPRSWSPGDLLKGILPVLLARFVTGGDPLVEALCAASAVAGAIWSVFAGFRSGRGVGTGVGTMLVIQPLAVVLATPVFVGVILLTRYVSLGSLLGSAAMLPLMLLFLLVAPGTPLSYVLYAAVGAGFIWLAHSDNINRLLHGTERKFDLGLLAGKRSSGS